MARVSRRERDGTRLPLPPRLRNEVSGFQISRFCRCILDSTAVKYKRFLIPILANRYNKCMYNVPIDVINVCSNVSML